jgi:hypothetical protein
MAGKQKMCWLEVWLEEVQMEQVMQPRLSEAVETQPWMEKSWQLGWEVHESGLQLWETEKQEAVWLLEYSVAQNQA